MCSIAGFYCYGEGRPSTDTLKGLMIAAQARGTSAAGMAYMNAKHEIMIRKQAGPAKNLVEGLNEDAWQEIARSPRALFHARATTKGTEKDNVNNHPVDAYGWLAVHNGHLSNDDELFAYYKEPRYAAVDTAAIPLVLKQGKDYDDSLRHLSLLGGQASVAVWSMKEPEKIAIARLGSNDVYLFLDPEKNIMYWCSTPLAGRAIPGFSVGNMGFFTVAKLHEDKVLILEPTRERARLLKIERRPFLPSRGWVNHTLNGGVITGGEGRIITLPAVMVPNRSRVEAHPLDRIGISGTKASGNTHGKASKPFMWIQPNPDLVTKPTIDISGLASTWFDWKDIITHFQEEYQKAMAVDKVKGATSIHTLYTAYGRWVFTCNDLNAPQVFATTFLPARRIKKYFRRHFSEQIPDNKLPVVLGNLDSVFTLEEFCFTEVTRTTPPGIIYIMGYMCPWCGILMRSQQWANLLYRCPCCGIVSPPYKKGEEPNVAG